MLLIRKPYDPHSRHQTAFHDEVKDPETGEITIVPHVGRTKQADAPAADINNIMERYRKRGILDHLNANQARYEDVADIDFHQAATVVAQAQQTFDSLPAELRKRFENDPAVFVDFMSDDANLEESYELGVRKRPQEAVEPPNPAPGPADPAPAPPTPPAPPPGE